MLPQYLQTILASKVMVLAQDTFFKVSDRSQWLTVLTRFWGLHCREWLQWCHIACCWSILWDKLEIFIPLCPIICKSLKSRISGLSLEIKVSRVETEPRHWGPETEILKSWDWDSQPSKPSQDRDFEKCISRCLESRQLSRGLHHSLNTG